MSVYNDREKAAELQNKRRLDRIKRAERLKAKGYSNKAIAEELGISETYVRTLVKN